MEQDFFPSSVLLKNTARGAARTQRYAACSSTQSKGGGLATPRVLRRRAIRKFLLTAPAETKGKIFPRIYYINASDPIPDDRFLLRSWIFERIYCINAFDPRFDNRSSLKPISDVKNLGSWKARRPQINPRLCRRASFLLSTNIQD